MLLFHWTGRERRDQIAAEVLRIQSTAKAIAGIDVFTSLSTVSMRNNYVKPKINEKGVINIKNGRHPVRIAQGNSEHLRFARFTRDHLRPVASIVHDSSYDVKWIAFPITIRFASFQFVYRISGQFPEGLI